MTDDYPGRGPDLNADLGRIVRPYPKAVQLARGERRYRRKVAGPKQWAAIVAEKQGPCRVCCDPCSNGSAFSRVTFHHIVTRAHGGDDVPDNIAPLCLTCHGKVTRRDATASRSLLESLTDAEYAYAVGKGGEGYFERAYGLRYTR